MKISFSKWETPDERITRSITAVVPYGETLIEQTGPVEWTSSTSAIGKIENLNVNGSFLMEFEFQENELRSWMRRFITENPEYSVQLLAEAHGLLLIAGQNKKNNKPT